MAASYPIVNGAEHAWVLHDPRFKPDPRLSNCPGAKPDYEQSAEDLIEHMRTYGVDKVVISQVCYYGRDNRYASHCIQRYPDRFAAIGLLVGGTGCTIRADPENPARLERARARGGLGRAALESHLRPRCGLAQ